MIDHQFDPSQPRCLLIADDNDDLPKKLNEVREESRLDAHKHDIYWCFALSTDIDQMMAELHASRKMVEKYAQMGAQNRISSEENGCLQDEKNAVLSYQNRLRDKFTEAMEKGTGLFRGVSWDASSLGKALSEIFKKLYGNVVPDLYPKLEMGSRHLKGDEAEQILKAADLKALPQVFYTGEKGLGLVTKEGPTKYVPNTAADVAKEVLDYLVAQNDYGNREERTGKFLEKRFGGIGYGWDRVLLYATGGYAYGSETSAGSITLGGNTFAASRDASLSGYVVGGGLEYAFTPNVSMKTEYLYFDFGKRNVFNGGANFPLVIDNDITMHTLKAGLNYRF